MWLLIELIYFLCLYMVTKWSAAFMAFPWSTGCAWSLRWKETQAFRLEKRPSAIFPSHQVQCRVKTEKRPRLQLSDWVIKPVHICLSPPAYLTEGVLRRDHNFVWFNSFAFWSNALRYYLTKKDLIFGKTGDKSYTPFELVLTYSWHV